eukprot:937501-Pelagomonas_calceolata.AAC.1
MVTHILPQIASAHFTNSKSKSFTQKSRHHVQGVVLEKISNLAQTSQDLIFFYKVKSHAVIAGNECADQ